MKNNRYKILVLSDLKKDTNRILKSTVSLARMIGGNIDFYHVKKPIDVVETESQLSAIRKIGADHVIIEKKINSLLKSISNEFDIQMNSSFTFGNVKKEINNYIETTKPDIIVLGKRKPNLLKIGGDNITDYVLQNHQGPVMIASSESVLEPNSELSIGVFNNVEESFNIDFANDLMSHAKKPLKSFKILNSDSDFKTTSKDHEFKTIDFVFEKNDSTINNLTNYLSKNKINLFCMSRENQSSKSTVLNSEVIKKLNVSLLFSGKNEILMN